MYWLLSGSLANSVVVWSDYSLLFFYTFYVISSALVTSAFPSLSTAGLYVLSHFSCVQLFVTLWAVAHQGPLSTGFSRQEYWSGLPCPPPGDPTQGSNLRLLHCRQIVYCWATGEAHNWLLSTQALLKELRVFRATPFVYLFLKKSYHQG